MEKLGFFGHSNAAENFERIYSKGSHAHFDQPFPSYNLLIMIGFLKRCIFATNFLKGTLTLNEV